MPLSTKNNNSNNEKRKNNYINNTPFQSKKEKETTKDNSFQDIFSQTYTLKQDNNYINNNINNKNKLNKTINGDTNEEEKGKIFKMLSQTLYNLCDNKGYIYFKFYISLAEELVLEYNISPQLNEMTKEVKNLVQSCLLPGKFHIKDILKIMRNKKYDSMYYTISQALKKKPSSLISQSIHLSQCIKKKALKKANGLVRLSIELKRGLVVIK